MFPDFFSSLSDDERTSYIKENYNGFHELPATGFNNLYVSEQFIFFIFVYHASEYKLFMDKKSGQITVGYVGTTEKYPFTIQFLSFYKDKMIYCVLPELIHDVVEARKNLEIDYNFFRQIDIAANPVLCVHTLKNKYK
jgi:hypothetical protein